MRLAGGLTNPTTDRGAVDHEGLRGVGVRQAVGSHEDSDAKALLGCIAFAMRGRHPKKATAKDVERLAQFSVLDLGLAMLGEGASDRIARVAPIAEREAFAEQNEFFRAKQKTERLGGEIPRFRECGESAAFEGGFACRGRGLEWLQWNSAFRIRTRPRTARTIPDDEAECKCSLRRDFASGMRVTRRCPFHGRESEPIDPAA